MSPHRSVVWHDLTGWWLSCLCVHFQQQLSIFAGSSVDYCAKVQCTTLAHAQGRECVDCSGLRSLLLATLVCIAQTSVGGCWQLSVMSPQHMGFPYGSGFVEPVVVLGRCTFCIYSG
jgi:hypothetical protein